MHSKMHSKYYSWINFGVCYCLKYSADNISRICLELEEIPSIKLTSLTSWYRSISNQRVNHQIFRIVGPCGSCEDVIFLQCPSQSSLFFQKEDCRYFYESRQKKSSGAKDGISRWAPQFLLMSFPLNMGREMVSDLKSSWAKRNLQEPFHSIILYAGWLDTNNVKYI